MDDFEDFIKELLKPIDKKKPAGEYLKYTREPKDSYYTQIKKAQREDNIEESYGELRNPKVSDWNEVIELAKEALTQKTKDLQIAIWLFEALYKQYGFKGVAEGFHILKRLLVKFWKHLHPQIENENYQKRANIINSLGKGYLRGMKQIPITDTNSGTAYSWLDWEKTCELEKEQDISKRNELISDGYITTDTFNKELSKGSVQFYKELLTDLKKCKNEYKALSKVIEKKFKQSPIELIDLKTFIDDIELKISHIHESKNNHNAHENLQTQSDLTDENKTISDESTLIKTNVFTKNEMPSPIQLSNDQNPSYLKNLQMSDELSLDSKIWDNAIELTTKIGFEEVISSLHSLCCRSISKREHNRYRLIIAKLCLKHNKPELALPILEDLETLINKYNLEKWESPLWISDIYSSLHQCLTVLDDENEKLPELFRKICNIDMTKAMKCKILKKE